MGELAGGGADLADLLGPAAAEVAERLYEAPGWPARFALLERFIAARVHDAPPTTPELEWAWGRLLASDGAVPVGSLAREIGWSRRHLAARFREHLGLPPKPLAASCASSAPPSGCAPAPTSPTPRSTAATTTRRTSTATSALRGRDPDRVPGRIRPRHPVRARVTSAA